MRHKRVEAREKPFQQAGLSLSGGGSGRDAGKQRRQFGWGSQCAIRHPQKRFDETEIARQRGRVACTGGGSAVQCFLCSAEQQ
jgi:hypothetical protein